MKKKNQFTGYVTILEGMKGIYIETAEAALYSILEKNLVVGSILFQDFAVSYAYNILRVCFGSDLKVRER